MVATGVAAGVVVDGVGGISSFVEGDGLPEVTVVTSVAPVVVISIGKWGIALAQVKNPAHSVVAVVVVVVVGPAVTGAAAVVEH